MRQQAVSTNSEKGSKNALSLHNLFLFARQFRRIDII